MDKNIEHARELWQEWGPTILKSTMVLADPQPETTLDEAAHEVARRALTRSKVEDRWGMTFGSTHKLYLAEELLNANTELARALDIYEELLPDE
jgi:hypothetical protein